MPDEKDNKLEQTGKALAKKSGLFAGKKAGLAARLEENKIVLDPKKSEFRIGMIPDDSGSMGGEKIQNAIKAIGEFLHACNPANTSVAMYAFHPTKKYKLTTDLISMDILKNSLDASQGTPLFGTMSKLIEDNPEINRAIIFSDGEATDGRLRRPEEEDNSWGSYRDDVVEKYQAAGIPVDTVFITEYASAPDNWTLQEIANRTGGLYLRFSDSGTFAKAFKFLSPSYRGLLEDPNFRKQIGAQ